MQVSETIVLELKDGLATVSTADLMRIIEMPSGRVVGDLAEMEETSMEVTSDDDRKRFGPWRIAVDYHLLSILERSQVTLHELAVPPIPKGHCHYCGAWGHKEKGKRKYSCGTISKRDKKLGYWRKGEQTIECRTGELERLHIMVQKSELLRKVLTDAGVVIDNPEYWWLIDGRPDDSQFTTMPHGRYAESA
ncbi:hypothetical protein [Lacipirellula sp.]|uniref:hypothetical protein n=1 Tax=Lacipirellula sp. TaxID=2691419 RepID=UPI003D095A8B